MSQQSIYIIGAQCTGKTTLVNALKDAFTRHREHNITEPEIISEVARRVLSKLNIDRHDIANTPEKSLQLQTAILQAQYTAEAEAIAHKRWYISDRSGIDPIVYTRLSVSDDAAQTLLKTSEWMSMEQNMKAGLVFVCEAGCTWLVDDGTRWMPDDAEHWEKFHQTFCKLLEERGIAYQVVPRDVAQIHERVQIVLGDTWTCLPDRTIDMAQSSH